MRSTCDGPPPSGEIVRDQAAAAAAGHPDPHALAVHEPAALAGGGAQEVLEALRAGDPVGAMSDWTEMRGRLVSAGGEGAVAPPEGGLEFTDRR
jgi:hypothetical protein